LSAADLRAGLVDALAAGGWLRSPRVRDAFLETPRELFLPGVAERDGLVAVYRNEAIVTKRSRHGMPLSSSSQPTIMALMLEQLELADGMRVLEVGAGTGWNAALIAHLVRPSGRVTTIDVDGAIAKDARRALRAAGSDARVVVKDGRDGLAEGAPYDRIVVTASADAIPIAWSEQLAPDGRLQAPIRLSASGTQAIALLQHAGARRLRSVGVLAGGFMPLRGPDGAPAETLWPPELVAVHRHGRSETPLREVHGVAVGSLSERAKRRLLATALQDPRRVPLGLRAAGPALTLFLSLTLPVRHLVMSAPRFGVGAIARDGASLALVEPMFDRAERPVSSLLAFGTDEAENLLRDRVADWNARGRPDAGDLAITVRYDAAGTSRITHRWPRRAGS
jgi:protein-L-isoaspartate(D-aspartate) O-methyltransferase